MKYLVTGGCGFIGSHLVDRILENASEVHIIDNMIRGMDFWKEKTGIKPFVHKVDICDFENLSKTLNEINPQVIFHLAANHYIPMCENNPYETFKVNLGGTINLIEAASELETLKKFFFASTGDVYGPSSHANNETDIAAPIYFYGESKLLAEKILQRYSTSNELKFDIIIGRLFNACGTRETNPHFLPEITRQIEKQNKILEVGNTWPMRDFVDVYSMVRIIFDLTHTVQGLDIYNIGSGIPQTVGNALEILTGAHSKGIEIISVKERQRPNDRPFLCPNIDKLRTTIGKSCEPFNKKTADKIWQENENTRTIY